MSKIIQFLKTHKRDIMSIFILLLLSYKAWYFLPQLTIRSDGFLYMLNATHERFLTVPLFFTGFNTSAMVFGYIFSKTFGVHLALYYWTVLIVMMLINILFYVTIKKITKRHIVSFSASLLLGVNYFGVYDMVTTHCYCFFLERIIPVIFLIPSFLFLHLFLEEKRRRDYVISLAFYFTGVGIGHFTVLFTPFYFLYPVFWTVFNDHKIKQRIRKFGIGASYLFLSGFFVLIQQINQSVLGPHNWTFIEFLFHPEKYLYFKKIALQFVYWSQYPLFLQDLSLNPMSFIIDARIAGSYIPLAITMYGFAALIIYKFLPQQRAMLLTTIFGTITMFYLNAYFGQYDILGFSGLSRYLYLPTFLLAIFWSYFLWAIFWRKKSVLFIGGLLVLGWYYAINVWLITTNARFEIYWNTATRAIYDYATITRSRLSPQTLIVVTYPEFGSQESTFLTEQIGKGQVRYISDNNLVNALPWEGVASSSAHVLRLSYDKKCNCVIEEKIK